MSVETFNPALFALVRLDWKSFSINGGVDCFISFYCSGGMDVKGNLFSLHKGMSAVIMAMNEMKR